MKYLKILIIVLGLSRFVGDTFRIELLDNLGFASGFSPLPLVFSDRQGIEDFAHEIKLTFHNESNKKIVYFDQQAYTNIEGPLNRVGVYAIALAYSPRFPKSLWENVLKVGLCKNGALYKAFLLDSNVDKVFIEISHLERKNLFWNIEVLCQ